MQILSVLEASCKDCHRCLRHCPVGAIGFGQDQAWIIQDKCIYCGRCVNNCPQEAKVPYNGIELLSQWLETGDTVIASVAPSFAAALEMENPCQFPAALKKLGFTQVTETVMGAHYIAQEYAKQVQNRSQPLISTCCPTIVNLVEKHMPEMIPYLATITSPMLAHGQILKKIYGSDSKVVFIGPCISKMDEIVEERSSIDLVVTFRQITELLQREKLIISQVSPENFDCSSGHWPRNYPLRGGALSAIGIDGQEMEEQVLAVTGIEECIQTMKDILEGRIAPAFVEMMACRGGCINGPEIERPLSVAARRQLVLKYNQLRPKNDQYTFNQTDMEKAIRIEAFDLSRQYQDLHRIYQKPNEEQIQEILRHIGKFSKEDETNCGGCGYGTCREKAIAVYQGLAEEKMCIPYMKGRIESLAHIIVESSHNAIIVVDQGMMIQEFNPVANQLFNRKNESPINKPLHRYIDPQLFHEVWGEKKKIYHRKVAYEQYQLVTDQTIFPLEEYGVIVGIITDISDREEQKSRMADMKKLAVEKTSDVVHKQMKIVQEIAKLLGETTVETKAALYELTQLLEEGEMG